MTEPVIIRNDLLHNRKDHINYICHISNINNISYI